MGKSFMLNIENLNSEADVVKINEYFTTNLKGVEKIDTNLSLRLVTIHYNETIGSPKYILDAFSHLGYSVR